MCLAIYQPAGQAVPEDILRKAVTRNPDGSGIVYWDKDGKPHGWRTMDDKDFVKVAMDFANYPALFHARIGTSGNKDLDNCHPFEVHPYGDKERPPYYIMHNGVLPITQHPQDPFSDTWHFARFLEKQGDVGVLATDKEWVSYMEDLIGNNKVLIAAPHADVTILNEWMGKWKDGIWYSNDYCLPQTAKVYVYSNGQALGTTGSSKKIGDDDAFGASEDGMGSYEQWGAEVVWEDREDPDSHVKTQVLVGWRFEDGTFIAAQGSLGKQEEKTAAGNIVDPGAITETFEVAEDKEAEVSALALELLAAWHGEVVAAADAEDLLQDAQDVIEFDVAQDGSAVIAHAIVLLMRNNLSLRKALNAKEQEAKKQMSPTQQEGKAGEKLTRAQRRQARRNRRHMIALTA